MADNYNSAELALEPAPSVSHAYLAYDESLDGWDLDLTGQLLDRTLKAPVTCRKDAELLVRLVREMLPMDNDDMPAAEAEEVLRRVEIYLATH